MPLPALSLCYFKYSEISGSWLILNTWPSVLLLRTCALFKRLKTFEDKHLGRQIPHLPADEERVSKRAGEVIAAFLNGFYGEWLKIANLHDTRRINLPWLKVRLST
jgi:hypothetical protein